MVFFVNSIIGMIIICNSKIECKIEKKSKSNDCAHNYLYKHISLVVSQKYISFPDSTFFVAT